MFMKFESLKIQSMCAVNVQNLLLNYFYYFYYIEGGKGGLTGLTVHFFTLYI
jgi:hypothetical protein